MSKQKTETYFFRDDGRFPNHPWWPLLIHSEAVPLATEDPAGEFEKTFRRHGWGGLWRDGIYRYHHYHSNSHEVLGIYAGHAEVQFGGPDGTTLKLKAGDVAVLPAGTVHKNVGASDDFGVVGGYPPGPQYDMCYGKPTERVQAVNNIRQTVKPQQDPVFGKNGGLCKLWPE